MKTRVKQVIVICILLVAGVSLGNAQGLYNNSKTIQKTESFGEVKETKNGLLREGDDGMPGGGIEEPGTPVSDTFWVFLLGATIYYGFKKRAAIKE